MKKIAEIDQLKAIADAAFEVDRAKLLKLNKRETDLRRTLAELDFSRGISARTQREIDEPAVIACAEMQWFLWIDQRRSMINTELAQVLANKSRLITQAQKSFGKQQAIDDLRDRVRGEKNRVLQRKFDQTS